MIYLKIITEDAKNTENESVSWFFSFVYKILKCIIPLRNPDFEDKIELIKFWLLEFENIEEPPLREIGLDKNNQILMVTPYKKNAGFWVDNNLNYVDFTNSFRYEVIDEKYFMKQLILAKNFFLDLEINPSTSTP
jgi:hypothetical protein